jgi:hypothetical protein
MLKFHTHLRRWLLHPFYRGVFGQCRKSLPFVDSTGLHIKTGHMLAASSPMELHFVPGALHTI